MPFNQRMSYKLTEWSYSRLAVEQFGQIPRAVTDPIPQGHTFSIEVLQHKILSYVS